MAGMLVIEGDVRARALDQMDDFLDAAAGAHDVYRVHSVTEDSITSRFEFVTPGTQPNVNDVEVAEAEPMTADETIEIAARLALHYAAASPELAVIK